MVRHHLRYSCCYWMGFIMVMAIHQRLAELHMRQKMRELTDGEALEFVHCLDANVKLCWEMAYLENMSYITSEAKNVNWQHEISAEIDYLQLTGTRQKKKPGSKRNTD